MTDREYVVLKLHRERLDKATNFVQFKVAQLALLDWLLGNYENREAADEKTDNTFIEGPTL